MFYLDTRKVNAQTTEVANGKVVESSVGFDWNVCLVLVKSLMQAKLKIDGLTANLERSVHEM